MGWGLMGSLQVDNATRCIDAARPRRNRVTPVGDIEISAYRGTLMGNRGDLHAADGTISRSWKVKAWLTCTLAERNRNRVTFDAPGRYTPLFFGDEAVALAAGHRPCAQCRKGAYARFKACWRAADGGKPSPTAEQMDACLHAARIDREGRKVMVRAHRLLDLPDGAFVLREGVPGRPLLLWGSQLYPWRHSGYDKPYPAPTALAVNVLTPAPIVEVLRAGYRPAVALNRTDLTNNRHRGGY